MKHLLLFLFCVAIVGVFGRNVYAHARSCALPAPIEVEYRQSAAVFTGRATSQRIVRGSAHDLDVSTVTTFEVQRWWKGDRPKTVEVRTCGGDNVGCTGSFEFRLGIDYVVFAQRRPLETSSCLRTGTLQESAETLKWLNMMKQ